MLFHTRIDWDHMPRGHHKEKEKFPDKALRLDEYMLSYRIRRHWFGLAFKAQDRLHREPLDQIGLQHFVLSSLFAHVQRYASGLETGKYFDTVKLLCASVRFWSITHTTRLLQQSYLARKSSKPTSLSKDIQEFIIFEGRCHGGIWEQWR
jgi:hypothetical protein